jgi:hypothetical protein
VVRHDREDRNCAHPVEGGVVAEPGRGRCRFRPAGGRRLPPRAGRRY